MGWNINKENIIIFYNDTVDARMAGIVLSDFYKNKCTLRKFNPLTNILIDSGIDLANTHIILMGAALQQNHIETIKTAKQKGAYVSFVSTVLDETFDYTVFDNIVIRTGSLQSQSLTSVIYIELYGDTSDMPRMITLFSIYASNEKDNEEYEIAEYVYRYIEVESELSIPKLRSMYYTSTTEDDLSAIFELGKMATKSRTYYLNI